MRHRTSLLSGLPLLLLSTAIAAQEPPPPPPPAQPGVQQTQQPHPVVQKRLDVLFRGITLTTEQQTRVDTILTRNRAEIQRLAADYHADNGDNGNGMSDDLKSALEKQEKEIRDVLTPDQRQLWDRNGDELKKKKNPMDPYQQRRDSLR